MTEHTPTLPWKADESDDYWILGGTTGGKVAEVTFPEDRPLVVRAVNAHNELVAALEAIVNEWGKLERFPVPRGHPAYGTGETYLSPAGCTISAKLIEKALEALAKVKEEAPA